MVHTEIKITGSNQYLIERGDGYELKTTTKSNQHLAEFQETNAGLELEQEIVKLMNDLSRPPPNMTFNYYQQE